MRTTIQQLEDLKEWSKDSTRYERRLAFRSHWSEVWERKQVLYQSRVG